MYLIHTPKVMRLLTPSFAEWEVPAVAAQPTVYLTFDDGPHPQATVFALEQLAKYRARATFFCIGKNVVENTELYQRIVDEGHAVGNHTHNHLKGWETDTKDYIDNTQLAAQFINSKLFRPPYGRIKHGQAKQLHEMGYRLVMWSLLSGDFDVALSPERCLENVIFNLQPGNIVVFHDSAKAWGRMSHALPRVLEYCTQKGWALEGL
ncbi:MAG: polysaccharide deacetylase family protein [Edaphocola sp.]